MPVQLDTQYFREYGVHTVDAKDRLGPVHIFSWPDWESLYGSLTRNLPADGTVLTTELAAFPRPYEEIAEHEAIIDERVGLIRSLSRMTQARIALGVPLKDEDNRWFNAVLHFQRGEVVGRDIKIGLRGFELSQKIISKGVREERIARFGRTTMICSELLYCNEVPEIQTSTVLAPTCWDVPSPSVSADDEQITKAGGVDAWLKMWLSDSVKSTMINHPRVDTVIVADRNMSGLGCEGPLNAIFRRRND